MIFEGYGFLAILTRNEVIFGTPLEIVLIFIKLMVSKLEEFVIFKEPKFFESEQFLLQQKPQGN